MSCPICGAKTDPKYRPFCSKRCADVDLGRWMGGQYSIATDTTDDPEELIEALEEAVQQKPH